MSTELYCPQCRIGRLDEEDTCPLCGLDGSHVGRIRTWALGLGDILGNINFSLVAFGLLLLAMVLVGLGSSSWLTTGAPREQLPAAVNEVLVKLRTEPGNLVLDLIWRAFLQAMILTAIIVAISYKLWKHRQRRS